MGVEISGSPTNVGFIIGVLFMALASAWGFHSAWRTRGVPKTREQVFQDTINTLQKQVDAQDEQIRMLLDDRMHDRERIRELEQGSSKRIRALELRIAELESEAERYQAQSPRRGAKSTASYVPDKKLSGGQLQALRVALLDVYTTQDDWAALLQDAEHPSLDIIATGDNLEIKAGKVLKRANDEGWIEHIIKQAADQRPNLPSFQDLTQTLLKVLDRERSTGH